MGRTGSSSSRRKHSNKKSLKVSSKGYRKKKSRRNKSKKLRHRDDSFSSSSNDDESTSSSLNSSSSSEGEFKTKRARSGSRSEIKGSKKRKRRRYTSEDSSDGSLVVKKRKRSKKSKRVKKKGSKRDSYVSSASSDDSGSCSTCRDEDSSSDEPGSHERSRGRSKEKGRRGSTKGRIGNRKNGSKSTRRSVSPSSSYDGERVENKNMIMENNPVRLKSVITVANVENDEEENMKNDELKEEILYDYDDYPSSKSNDSVELGDRLNSSNFGDNGEKQSNIFNNIGSEADDLESILRQKALENLSRFRGGIKTKPVVPVDDKPKLDPSDVNPLQPVTHKSRFTWKRDTSGATVKDEKAATYSDNKIVNETSMMDTGNVDQKSTAVVETPSIKEGSSKEHKNESNDNSQFEKKTMSVMRGGEMVQVSYKVYIPNKAPALARRQLKR